MKSNVKILAIVLLAQILASVLLLTGGERLEAFKAEEPLLNLSLDDLTTINITVHEKDQPERIESLTKDDGNWVIASHFSFPVSEEKLDVFRNVLFNVKRPYPVGSSASAAKRFEVSDDSFQTKVEFKNGEKVLDTLYVGSSPAFKKAHVRTKGSDFSYAIDFSSFELRGKGNTWINRDYVKIDRESVQGIEYKDILLKRNSETDTLTLDGLADDEQIVDSEFSTLVSATTQMSFLDVLGTEEKEEYNLKEPALVFSVTLKDGTKSTYSLGEVKEETHFVLKVSNKPFYLKVAGFQVNKFKDTTRASLVEKKEEKAETSTSSNSSEEADSSEETGAPEETASSSE
ncbi:MAG: DUF4340 domain-containing protein [Bdellovibrionales bacterium]|nr:DUF4340 domain-containing protein [Bdellovibrionales bacterium]